MVSTLPQIGVKLNKYLKPPPSDFQVRSIAFQVSFRLNQRRSLNWDSLTDNLRPQWQENQGRWKFFSTFPWRIPMEKWLYCPMIYDGVSQTSWMGVGVMGFQLHQLRSKWSIWVFPKSGGVYPPNHPFVHRVSMIFTIHFGGPPLFLETPIFMSTWMVDFYGKCIGKYTVITWILWDWKIRGKLTTVNHWSWICRGLLRGNSLARNWQFSTLKHEVVLWKMTHFLYAGKWANCPS